MLLNFRTQIIFTISVVLLLGMVMVAGVLQVLHFKDSRLHDIRSGIAVLESVLQADQTGDRMCLSHDGAVSASIKNVLSSIEVLSLACRTDGGFVLVYEAERGIDHSSCLDNGSTREKYASSNGTTHSGWTWTSDGDHVYLNRKGFCYGRLPTEYRAVLKLTSLSSFLLDKSSVLLLYIFVNFLILIVICYTRLDRYLFKPIDKLVQQADYFSDVEEFSMMSGRHRSDFNSLAYSLNRMINRSNRDNAMLRETVRSLEKANADMVTREKEMVRAEKLSSVGRLAAGLAHEIGNPLAAIMGFVEILKGGARAELHDSQGKAVISLHDCLLAAMTLAKMDRKSSGIVFVNTLHASQDGVSADFDQLRQVFFNCLQNAMDAIHQGCSEGEGKIIVTSRNVVEGEKRCAIEISIRDNGCGVAAEDLEHIFDPFFTRKEIGEGTGLGLSVAYSIIERLGGNISATSEAGLFTEVVIQIPVTGDAE